MIETFDPNIVADKGSRQVIITLINMVETLSVQVVEHAEKIQQLRNEIHRLKGEQGKPTFTPKNPTPLLPLDAVG